MPSGTLSPHRPRGAGQGGDQGRAQALLRVTSSVSVHDTYNEEFLLAADENSIDDVW